MDKKDIVLQGGSIVCPICQNKFNWSYKLTYITDVHLGSKDTIATSIESTPHRYISHVSNSNGSIRFIIGCERCGYNIETDYMELINKDNFEANRNS